MASHLDRVLPAAAQDGVLQNVRQSRVVRRGGPPHTPEYCVEGPPPVPPHPNGMGANDGMSGFCSIPIHWAPVSIHLTIHRSIWG